MNGYERDEWGVEFCDSTFDDQECCRLDGHRGLHQNRPCDGTCDTCDCMEWSDTEADEYE